MKHEGDRFDILRVGELIPTDANYTRGKVEVEIYDKDKNRKFYRTGRWVQIGNFAPIWVTIEGQEIMVEELIKVPSGADLMRFGVTVSDPPKHAKFVNRFRYRIPKFKDTVGTSRVGYVSPGCMISFSVHYRAVSGPDQFELPSLGRVLDRPIYDGCGKKLEEIHLRCLVASEDFNTGFQRYVKLDDVIWASEPPAEMASFFFAKELPPPEIVIQWIDNGSVNQRYMPMYHGYQEEAK